MAEEEVAEVIEILPAPLTNEEMGRLRISFRDNRADEIYLYDRYGMSEEMPMFMSITADREDIPDTLLDVKDIYKILEIPVGMG